MKIDDCYVKVNNDERLQTFSASKAAIVIIKKLNEIIKYLNKESRV